jgi:hypothetical protein
MQTPPPATSGSAAILKPGSQLKQFISQHLPVALAAKGRIGIIARSSTSPVIEALSEHAAALPRGQVEVRIVLHEAGEKDVSGLIEALSLDAATQMRHAGRPRLIDAHEQLVMGDLWCWYGDSMRRDPRKRDAFASFSDGNAELARLAWLSFNRIWQVSDALPSRTTSAPVAAVETAAALATAVAARREPLLRQ